jgi:hypothetical protein
MSFLGVLGSVFKGIAGGVAGFATGGPVGAIGGAASGLGLFGGSVKSASVLGGMPVPSRFAGGGPGFGMMPTFSPLSLTGGSPRPGQGSALIPHFQCDRGMHHKKVKGFFAGNCVRNRRMNVTNPKALRRSIRRLTGFEKLARRVLRITTHKPVTVHGFKRGRKRRS